MRILITTDTVGGVWSYTRELVSGLLGKGVEVLLFTLGQPLQQDQELWVRHTQGAYLQSFQCHSTHFRLEWMENAGADVKASRESVAQSVQAFCPDLLHANQFCFASLGLGIPVVLAVHSDIRSWWRAVHDAAPPDSEWFRGYDRQVREGLCGATTVVAPTQWMLNQICRDYGVPEASTSVIPNGCSPESYDASRPKRLQAVSIGRLWDEGKNVASLSQMRSQVPILIAGDTRPPAGSIAAAWHEPQRDGSAHYLGRLATNRVRELLAESAIYIACSRYEPFGLAPLEAAFSGCAILANDIPSLREVWGEDALFYRENDNHSLTECLDALADDPDLLARMAGRARRRASERYTGAAMTEAYLGLYRSALELHSAGVHA
jgi:glycosyltransferase involved in cell wall biosynthesis